MFKQDQLLPLVLSKKLGKDKVKLEKGKYHLKGYATIEIDVEVNKGEDENYQPTSKLPIKEVLATLVKKFKITQGQLEELIVEAYTNARNDGVSIKEELEFTEHTLNKVNKVLGKLPSETREGKTLMNGFVRIIDKDTKVAIEKLRVV